MTSTRERTTPITHWIASWSEYEWMTKRTLCSIVVYYVHWMDRMNRERRTVWMNHVWICHLMWWILVWYKIRWRRRFRVGNLLVFIIHLDFWLEGVRQYQCQGRIFTVHWIGQVRVSQILSNQEFECNELLKTKYIKDLKFLNIIMLTYRKLFLLFTSAHIVQKL